MTSRRRLEVRVENFDVFVNGRRVREPGRRLVIALPAVILGILIGMFVMFVILPLVGLGLAVVFGLFALLLASIAVFLVFSPILIPALAAIGLFRWLMKE